MAAVFSDLSVNSQIWGFLVNATAASPALSPPTRTRILRRCGVEVVTTDIHPGCWFFSADVRIGEKTLINHRCYFDSRESITIGDRCSLAPEVMLCTSGHRSGDAAKRAGPYEAAPIAVGNGSWLGTRATILGGVTVGVGCIVAAGAVVTQDCAPHGMYAGVPARRVRDL